MFRSLFTSCCRSYPKIQTPGITPAALGSKWHCLNTKVHWPGCPTVWKRVPLLPTAWNPLTWDTGLHQSVHILADVNLILQTRQRHVRKWSYTSIRSSTLYQIAVSDQFHTPAYFLPSGQEASATHRIWYWSVFRTCAKASEKRSVSCSCQESSIGTATCDLVTVPNRQ